LDESRFPGWLWLTPDEGRLVISDYFLNEDNFGKVHAEGDHRINVARVTEDNLILDPRFQLDFNVVFSTGPAHTASSLTARYALPESIKRRTQWLSTHWQPRR
jgi:hypothetical protein